jgi:hypothetical protein
MLGFQLIQGTRTTLFDKLTAPIPVTMTGSVFAKTTSITHGVWYGVAVVNFHANLGTMWHPTLPTCSELLYNTDIRKASGLVSSVYRCTHRV